MQTIATEVPTSIEELADCGLPEKVQKEYGERLVKNLNSFIEQNELQQYLNARPKKKRKLDSKKSLIIEKENKPVLIDVPDDSDDEFGDDGIDYSAIEIPGSQKSSTSMPSKVARKSKFF